MPFWSKKPQPKAAWEIKQEENAKKAAAGLVKVWENEWSPEANHGQPGYDSVEKWVSPEEAARRAVESKAKSNAIYKGYKNRAEADRRSTRNAKLAECKAFIAQAEAEIASEGVMGGTRKRKNTRTRKNRRRTLRRSK